MADQHIPRYSLNVTGLTDSHSDDPAAGVQFAVLDTAGEHHTYGDQPYVACGQARDEAHPGGRIQRRTITITYGEWEDHA